MYIDIVPKYLVAQHNLYFVNLVLTYSDKCYPYVRVT
jgi:hypothetical protein